MTYFKTGQFITPKGVIKVKKLKKAEKLIIELGLPVREAKVYTTLFQKREFTAVEIQQLTDIPSTKVYDVLRQLIGKGMCKEKKVGRHKKYEAVNPETVFSQIQDDFEEKKNIAKSASTILSSIFEEREEEDNPLDYIEVLKDKNQIHSRWVEYQRNVKKEILAFTKAPYTHSSFNDNIDDEFNALRKGVTIRSIYEYKDMTDKDRETIISSWIASGEEARIVEELPVKMAIFDERITMISLNDPISLKPSLTTMIVNHPSFAKTMKYIFNSIWEKAKCL